MMGIGVVLPELTVVPVIRDWRGGGLFENI
jgi:hypothetical protein